VISTTYSWKKILSNYYIKVVPSKMMDSDNELTPKYKTISKEHSKKIQTDSNCLQDNINRFNKQLFKDIIEQFSRYTSVLF